MTTASTSLLGLALPVTGELSGTWGDVVNNSITNLLDSAIAGTTTLSADADVTLTTTTLSANQAREAIILWTANGTTTRNITAPAQSKIYTVINASAGTQSIVLRGAGPTTGVTIIKGESALCAWNGSDFIKISTSAGNGTFSTVTATAATTASSNLGAYRYGTLSFSDTGIVQSMQTSVNSYFQNVIQNTSAGTAASAEFIAYNDQGTASTNYATVGINSSGYSGTGSINAPGYGYFLSASTDLVLGTIGANAIHFTTNSSATDALAISSAGAVSLPGGTANGVAYLNGSKVVTTGSALTFDGATLGVNGVSVGRGAGAVSTNTAVGASALAANTSGSLNTGVGYQVLYSNTSGAANYAFGYQTMYSNTTGSNNNAYGYQSLYNNLSGGNNAAFAQASLLSNTTGTYNAAFGYGSLQLNTTGGNNTAVGSSALFSNTTASNNTAVGYTASYSNSTGDQNVAIGKGALFANQTGASNVAVGARALEASTANYNTALGFAASFINTTGTRNVSVGYLALYANTTGNSNTAVGASALVANTTGSSNTAVGDTALNTNTTADNNTAVGYQSLYLNTAAYNTAVGRSALYGNTTGNENAVVGGAAGFANTTGSGLSALGYLALRFNTTGNYNTAVGDSALYSNTTASGNTAVGFGAMYSNTTSVGNTAVGFQAATNGTTGVGNTTTGYQASYYATGGYNTVMGYQAFYGGSGTSTGGNNVAIGGFALNVNTSGNYNVGLGYQALQANTTASYNTAVGYQAGYTNTAGLYCTYIGGLAGANTTGSNNTFVGQSCGQLVSTGSKNTIIGGYNGNQNSLDIRTASNYIVLSDGDGNPRGVFDGSGNFLVGATSSLGRFTLIGSAASSKNLVLDSNASYGEIQTYSAPLYLNRQGNDIITNAGGGNLLIGGTTATGTPTTGFTFQPASGSSVIGVGHTSGTASGTGYAYFAYNGSAIGSITQSGTTAVLYNVTSDQRLKENIADATEFGGVIDSIQVRQYDWKSDGSHQRYGFIAQELATVAPEAVHQPADPEEMMAVDYSKLVPMLVKEIQSLRKRLADAGI